jgi:hypothetical protein
MAYHQKIDLFESLFLNKTKSKRISNITINSTKPTRVFITHKSTKPTSKVPPVVTSTLTTYSQIIKSNQTFSNTITLTHNYTNTNHTDKLPTHKVTPLRQLHPLGVSRAKSDIKLKFKKAKNKDANRNYRHNNNLYSQSTTRMRNLTSIKPANNKLNYSQSHTTHYANYLKSKSPAEVAMIKKKLLDRIHTYKEEKKSLESEIKNKEELCKIEALQKEISNYIKLKEDCYATYIKLNQELDSLKLQMM